MAAIERAAPGHSTMAQFDARSMIDAAAAPAPADPAAEEQKQ